MKLPATILMAALLMPVAAVAQEWRTYTYSQPVFSVQFPAAPAVEHGTVKNPTGVSLPTTRYVVRQDRMFFSVSIVNYSSTTDDALTTIFATQKSLAATGKVTASALARLNRNLGRELSIDGSDGSRSAVSIFFVDRHLYTVVAQSLPPNATANSDDAARFQESLQFPDDSGHFGRFFFGGGNNSRAIAAAPAAGPAPAPAPAPAPIPAPAAAAVTPSVGAGPSAAAARPTGLHNPPSDSACAGKSAGDTVQLDTPNGPVPAICTLVARPKQPADTAP